MADTTKAGIITLSKARKMVAEQFDLKQLEELRAHKKPSATNLGKHVAGAEDIELHPTRDDVDWQEKEEVLARIRMTIQGLQEAEKILDSHPAVTKSGEQLYYKVYTKMMRNGACMLRLRSCTATAESNPETRTRLARELVRTSKELRTLAELKAKYEGGSDDD